MRPARHARRVPATQARSRPRSGRCTGGRRSRSRAADRARAAARSTRRQACGGAATRRARPRPAPAREESGPPGPAPGRRRRPARRVAAQAASRSNLMRYPGYRLLRLDELERHAIALADREVLRDRTGRLSVAPRASSEASAATSRRRTGESFVSLGLALISERAASLKPAFSASSITNASVT